MGYYPELGPDETYDLAGKWEDEKPDDFWLLEHALPEVVHHLSFTSGCLQCCECVRPTSIPIWLIYDWLGIDVNIIFNFETEGLNYKETRKLWNFLRFGRAGERPCSGSNLSGVGLFALEIAERIS